MPLFRHKLLILVFACLATGWARAQEITKTAEPMALNATTAVKLAGVVVAASFSTSPPKWTETLLSLYDFLSSPQHHEKAHSHHRRPG
jgi:hypothetical protein